MPHHPIPSWRLLREPSVIAAIGYSRASLRRLIKAGAFPKPVKLGAGQGGAVAWREDDILNWIKARQEGKPWTATAA